MWLILPLFFVISPVGGANFADLGDVNTDDLPFFA